MLIELITPFLAIGLAELGDKTQLAILSMSLQTKHHTRLLLGTVSAFVLADGAAILFGNYLHAFISEQYLHIGAGLLFIAMGIFTLFSGTESQHAVTLKNPFLSGFSMVLLLEMGDKSQLASAAFAAEFNPLLVFIGVITALSLLSILAIYIGKRFLTRIKLGTTSRIAGVIFVCIGAYIFMNA